MAKDQHFQPRSQIYKPWFDYVILAIAHLALLPMWLLLWTIIPILIWLGDRGPIFYHQERAGKNGTTFVMVKFRTMIPDAESKGPGWTIEGDPRVTRVGRLLRRTALDELPEVLNILKRDMSLVGPRALHLREHKDFQELIPGFDQRLQVLPGLTGLAQVYNRTDDGHKKFLYDVEYLSRMGPWLDIKLLTLSVWNTLGGRWDRRVAKSAHTKANLESLNPPKQPGETAGGRLS